MTSVPFLTLLVASISICNSQQQPQCDIANTTLRTDTDCNEIYRAFLNGVQNGVRPADLPVQSVYDQVCKEGACRSAILDYQNSCSATEEMETEAAEIVQAEAAETAFGCISHEMTGSCLNVSADTESGLVGFTTSYYFGDVGRCIRAFYFGMCSEECKQNVTRFVNQWGCCYAEFVRILAQIPEAVSPVQYAISVRDYFSFCDLPVPSFCMDGPTPPPSQCAMAVREVFSSDDVCATTWIQLISDDSSADRTIPILLRTPRCAERLQNFVTTCQFFESETTISFLLQLTVQFGNVINLQNGQRCSASFPGVIDALQTSMNDTILQTCFADLERKMCSTTCKQFLTESARSYGCCFFEGARIYYTADYPEDNEDNDNNFRQIFQAITVSLYTLCGIESPGFCTEGPTAPSLSTCDTATLSLFGPGDSCTSAVRRILDLNEEIERGRNVSFNEVDMEFDTFCSTQGCKQHLTNFFTACANINGNVNPQQSINYYTDFGCRRNNKGSCFAELATSRSLRILRDSQVCDSVVETLSCSTNCTQAVQAAVDAAGCCALELTYVGLSDANITITPEQAYQFCSVTSPGRCALQVAGDGAAATETANILLVSILVVLISLII